MRRAAVAALVLATAWLAMAQPAGALTCVAGPSPEAFARGEGDVGRYLVIGEATDARAIDAPPDANRGQGWDVQFDVTAVVGVDEAPSSLQIRMWGFQERRQALAFGPLALDVTESDGGVAVARCGSGARVDDVDAFTTGIEEIAEQHDTPFARPPVGLSIPWAKILVPVGTLAVVGALDHQRRRTFAAAAALRERSALDRIG